MATTEQFLIAWRDAHKLKGTIADVAKALDITPKYAHEFAARLRAKGAKLPKLKRVNTGMDAAAMNALVRGEDQ